MELKVFNNSEFGEIRTTVINNEPYFVGKDVAEILGYSNSRKALADHVDNEDKGVTKCDTLGGSQNLTVVNESGLYSLIMASKLPTAKQFKRWVTSEVLPSIRKNGGYIANQENLTREQIVANALIVANNIIADKDKLIAEQAERIEEMKPAELFAKCVEASVDSILIRDLAKILNENGVKTGEHRFYKWLRKNGFICMSDTMPTQRAMEMGLFEITLSTKTGADGIIREFRTTRVTGKGQRYFIKKLCGEVQDK